MGFCGLAAAVDPLEWVIQIRPARPTAATAVTIHMATRIANRFRMIEPSGQVGGDAAGGDAAGQQEKGGSRCDADQ